MPTLPTLATFPALAGFPPATSYPQVDVRNGVPLLAFDDAAIESIDFFGVLPASYGGGDLSVTIHWSADTATGGNVVWTAAYERHMIDDATLGDFDLDSDGFGTAQTATATAADNAGKLVRTPISIAASAGDNPMVGESFRLRVSRKATDAADTMTGDALLLAIDIEEA